MSLPSPFRFLDWDAASNTLIVELATSANTAGTSGKRWGLVSVDGTPAEVIVNAAKKEDGANNWLRNFAVMFPTYALASAASQANSFAITGSAQLELEDLESHEIEELHCDATEEAYDAAIHSWRFDDAVAGGGNEAGATATSKQFTDVVDGDDEAHDEATEEEEDDTSDEQQRYMEKRHLLDQFALMLDTTNKLGVHLRLTPQALQDAFVAAGGTLLTPEEESDYATKDMATATFLQTANAAQGGGAGQQCHQQ